MLAEKFGDGRVFLLAALVALGAQTARVPLAPDPPKICASCDGWNADRAPFRVFGNTYYVGTAGLGAMLITSSAGHILIDAALPQSAPLIDAHIRALGFRTEDIKFILTSHAHYDHIGGVAALQRFTGATVMASTSTKDALERGRPTDDDPQFRVPDNGFPAVANVKVVRDLEEVRLGPLRVIAHMTPGHTPGSTTWSWRSCEGTRCLAVVYADSLNAVSADEFRFTAGPNASNRIDAFKKSLAAVEALDCDVLMSVHPSFPGVNDRPGTRKDACRKYVANARKTLDERLAKELQSKGKDRQP